MLTRVQRSSIGCSIAYNVHIDQRVVVVQMGTMWIRRAEHS
jgi:hypothetical protein